MDPVRVINIAEEFSRAPSGRYYSDGDYTGQRFRDEFLVPALKSSKMVKVVLDGTRGYGSSFLEEAFGGLVREKLFTAEELISRLEISAVDTSYQRYVNDANRYISEAATKLL